MIDRNVNITNICFSQCRFCNFCRTAKSEDAYVTTDEEYDSKIREMIALGGDQLLLQGGMNPALGLDFYTGLFRGLKEPMARSETACPWSAGDGLARTCRENELPRCACRTP